MDTAGVYFSNITTKTYIPMKWQIWPGLARCGLVSPTSPDRYMYTSLARWDTAGWSASHVYFRRLPWCLPVSPTQYVEHFSAQIYHFWLTKRKTKKFRSGSCTLHKVSCPALDLPWHGFHVSAHLNNGLINGVASLLAWRFPVPALVAWCCPMSSRLPSSLSDTSGHFESLDLSSLHCWPLQLQSSCLWTLCQRTCPYLISSLSRTSSSWSFLESISSVTLHSTSLLALFPVSIASQLIY